LKHTLSLAGSHNGRMKTTSNESESDRVDVWLPRRILTDGWWLADPPRPVGGATIYPFKHPSKKSQADVNPTRNRQV